jgi:formylglycine-generating enzyme required for sulfatase activity
MRLATVATVVLLGAGSVHAEVVIETVAVGNPGNTGELSGWGAGGIGPDRICGAVEYPYEIGMYEVTAEQYTEFLNAVAATDTHRLYTMYMAYTQWYGCNIQRSGSPGGYNYSVPPDWADRPVTLVSWGDAARFANWLHNGQPAGFQDSSTTEDGSYLLSGATSDEQLLAIVRQPDATWVIPTEDEWYKAAYHRNDGVTGNYYDYPTSSDVVPGNDLVDPDPGNNAAYMANGVYTLGRPYYRTEVGDFENSRSAYGTFDQGGNVWEWNETVYYAVARGIRGGSFKNEHDYTLHAAYRMSRNSPVYESPVIGFRLVYVPEPTTLGLLAIGGLALLRRKR